MNSILLLTLSMLFLKEKRARNYLVAFALLGAGCPAIIPASLSLSTASAALMAAGTAPAQGSLAGTCSCSVPCSLPPVGLRSVQLARRVAAQVPSE